MQLVSHRTMHVLAVENVQARVTGARMTADRIKRLEIQDVESLGLNEDVTLGLQANVAVIGALSKEIEKLERRLAEYLQRRAFGGALRERGRLCIVCALRGAIPLAANG